MPTPIMTAKTFGNRFRSASAESLCSNCAECKFAEALKKDAKGRYVKGDWKQALLKRNDLAQDDAIARNNVNGWLKNVPCVVLPKGTELFHVSADSNWVRTSLVGSNNQDDGYSFFTLRMKGFADKHANDFRLRVQLRLREDVHAFFCPAYAFDIYRVGEEQYARGSVPKIEHSMPDKGGGLAAHIRGAWPGAYRPRAIIGCSECEIIIHSSLIPMVTETVAAATSTDGFKTRTIVNFGELPASKPKGAEVPFTPPAGAWMNPSNADETRADKVAAASKGRAAFAEENLALFNP